MHSPSVRRLPDAAEVPSDAKAFPLAVLAMAALATLTGMHVGWVNALGWWLLSAGVGAFRIIVIRRTNFDAMTEAQRKWRLRSLLWLFMAALSTSAYFLYEPHNSEVKEFLRMFYVGTGIFLVTQISLEDRMRFLVAGYLLATPFGLRLIAEAYGSGNYIEIGRGAVVLVVPALFTMLASVQVRQTRAQFDARVAAEGAAQTEANMAVAKSRFFASISHDLRQPVHSIGLYLDPIATHLHGSENPTVTRALVGITQSWQVLNDLLSQVLDLTRLEAHAEQPDLRPVQLQPLAQELVLQHSSVAERAGVRLVMLVRPECVVQADALMLTRVVSNLLSNAIKFSPLGATVVIAARPGRGVWRIQVRDAGPGIAPEDQTGVFDEFLQLNNHTRERTQGIGLGLSIAKRLTHLMQGSITVRSALGKGTCMTVCMPQASVRIEQSHKALATSLQAPQSYRYVQQAEIADARSIRRVLLVEDDVLVGGAMSDLLRSWGMQVQWVQTVEAAHEHVASLDIAICDVRLPGASSGLDFAIALKYQGKPVLLVTGETDAMTKSKAELHGIDLLVKPIASAELYRALANLQTPSMQFKLPVP